MPRDPLPIDAVLPDAARRPARRRARRSSAPRPGPARRRACRRRCSSRRCRAAVVHARAAAARGPRRGPAHGGRARHAARRRVRLPRPLRPHRPGRGRASSSSRRASCCGCCTTTRSSKRRRRRRLRRVPRARPGQPTSPSAWSGSSAQTVRPDLRVVVMSATLDAGPVGRVPRRLPGRRQRGPDCSRSRCATARSGRTSRGRRRRGRRSGRCSTGPTATCSSSCPGLREIRQTADELDRSPRRATSPCCRCTATCRPSSRTRRCSRSTARKVVLATNVAETSVTVEGVTGVVDTGLARQLVFDPAVGLDRLRLVPISRASADQRAGRAGRTRPGVCVRLWGEPGHRGRPEQTEPEIRRVDLAGAVLQLLALGEADVAQLPVARAAAAGGGRAGAATAATGSGRVDDGGADRPRAGRWPGCRSTRGSAGCWSKGSGSACPDRAALAAALLSERDPFPRARRRPARPHRAADRRPTCSTASRRWRRSSATAARRAARPAAPRRRAFGAARRATSCVRLAREREPRRPRTGRRARRRGRAAGRVRRVPGPARPAARAGRPRAASWSAAAACGSPRRSGVTRAGAVRLRRRGCRRRRVARPAGVGRRPRAGCRPSGSRPRIEVDVRRPTPERLVGPASGRGSTTWSSTRRTAHVAGRGRGGPRAGRRGRASGWTSVLPPADSAGRPVPHPRPLPARRGCRSWTCRRSTTPTCASCSTWLCRGRRSFADLRTAPTGSTRCRAG